MKKIFFNIGISGSGKSYYLKNDFLTDYPEVADFLIANQLLLNDIIVCADDIRREICGDVNSHEKEAYVWVLVMKRLNENLDKYGYTILDSTLVAGKDRNSILKHFKNAYKVALIYQPDLELSKERIKMDIENSVDRSNVPDYAIERQFEKFKSSIVGDLKWTGDWNKVVRKKIVETLKHRFDEIKFIKN